MRKQLFFIFIIIFAVHSLSFGMKKGFLLNNSESKNRENKSAVLYERELDERSIEKVKAALLSVKEIQDGALMGLNIKELDLTPYDNIRHIGKHFLYGAKIQRLVLPASIQRIGINFLRDAEIFELDMSNCFNLFHVDDAWFVRSKPQKLVLPKNITNLGTSFLAESYVKYIDLSHCEKLLYTGNYVFGETNNLEILVLPKNLQYLGKGFLNYSKIGSPDLRNAESLKDIDYGFLKHSTVDSVVLPNNIETIGLSPLAKIQGYSELELELLADGQLIEPRGPVLGYSQEQFIAENQTNDCRDGFMKNATIQSGILDLSNCKKLKSLGFDFLKNANVKTLILPHSIEIIQDGFLEGSTIELLDISRCQKLHPSSFNYINKEYYKVITLPKTGSVVQQSSESKHLTQTKTEKLEPIPNLTRKESWNALKTMYPDIVLSNREEIWSKLNQISPDKFPNDFKSNKKRRILKDFGV